MKTIDETATTLSCGRNGYWIGGNALQCWVTSQCAVGLQAAARFRDGLVTSPDLQVNEVMFQIVESLVRNDEDLTDEICASVALGLAELDVPARQFDKDGFARGIERKAVDVQGTTVGVLFPGGG